MRRGPWHQFGDRSQRLAIEQLQTGAGIGVILSPRDLARNMAIEYAQRYHGLGAHVLMDQQFYVPQFRNNNLDSYPIRQYRLTATQLHQIADSDFTTFATGLYTINKEISANGLIAPALVYEAGRPDIVQLNARLFAAARRAGDALGIPTYATVMIGRSAASSDQTLAMTLSQATALNSDGFYYGFEFNPERIPSSHEAVLRCCTAGLTLACTGLPVLHAYAGPMALLSLGFGATGVAIGHSQNLWRFTRSRWALATGQGGGGAAPARFFSSSLWGTITYPDEVAQLSAALQGHVLTHSPFSAALSSIPPYVPWARWDASKHLVNIICSVVQNMVLNADPRASATAAIDILQQAVTLHATIGATGVNLCDNTNAYQGNWLSAMNDLLATSSADFEYLALLT
jgi:hypothetical protein